MTKKSLTGERDAYRKALEEIIAGGESVDAVAIAHRAITPYTPWVAVEEDPGRPVPPHRSSQEGAK